MPMPIRRVLSAVVLGRESEPVVTSSSNEGNDGAMEDDYLKRVRVQLGLMP